MTSEDQLIHILLVMGHDPVADWLLATLRSEARVVVVGQVPSLERAMDVVGSRNVDVMLVDTSVYDGKQLERLQALATKPMSPAIIVIVDPDEMSFVQRAILAGARGFLLKPFTQSQLVESLRQAYGIVVQQRLAAGAVTALPAPQEQRQVAKVFVLFSPKGGVGRTSLAANLSIALYEETGEQVALVDGDLQLGDVDIAFNTIARKSIADLFGYVDELEPSLVESALITHTSGVRLLLAPPYYDPSMEANEVRLASLIEALAWAQKGYVVVDAPAGLSESTLGLFDVAHRVLLLTTASLSSLRATKRFLGVAANIGSVQDKIVLILAGYRKGVDIQVEDIERHLNWSVAAIVPSDPLAMALALNQGQPIINRDRNHAVSKSVVKLARYLAGELADGIGQESGVGVPSASADGPMTGMYTTRLAGLSRGVGT